MRSGTGLRSMIRSRGIRSAAGTGAPVSSSSPRSAAQNAALTAAISGRLYIGRLAVSTRGAPSRHQDREAAGAARAQVLLGVGGIAQRIAARDLDREDAALDGAE